MKNTMFFKNILICNFLNFIKIIFTKFKMNIFNSQNFIYLTSLKNISYNKV